MTFQIKAFLLSFVVLAPSFSAEISTQPKEAKAGEDGKDASHKPPNNPGQSGKDGGDAQEAQKTQASKGLDLSLVLEDGELIVRGQEIKKDGRSGRVVGAVVSIDSKETILLNTSGRDGLRGHDAGMPQPGADGRNGKDAIDRNSKDHYLGRPDNLNPPTYRLERRNDFTAPTAGEPGGNTGHAGQATDGRDGGDAGDVILEISEDQIPLLVAFEFELSGGKGGKKGKAITQSNMPNPGKGGKKGEGLDRYPVNIRFDGDVIYSETLIRRRHAREESRAIELPTPEGKKLVYVKIPVPAAIPDAKAGEDGELGDISDQVRAGRKGKNGHLFIHVKGTGDLYQGVFSLQIKDASIRGFDADDGIIEPGENLVIELRLHNPGSMPTPATEILLDLTFERDWKKGSLLQESVALPEIPAGGTIVHAHRLNFTPQNLPVIKNGDPKARKVFLNISSSVPKAGDRPVPGTRVLEKSFDVRHLVEISPLEALPYLEPGEATKLRLKVKNISNSPFSSYRELQLGFALNPETEIFAKDFYENLVLVDEAGKKIDPRKAFFSWIGDLDAGEERVVELRLGVRKQAQNFGVNLTLDMLLKPLQERRQYLAQEEERALNVQLPFDPNAKFDVLVVVPPDLLLSEREAILHFYAASSLDCAFFPLTLKSELNLRERVGDKTLEEHLENKVVAVYNRYFHEGESRAIPPDQLYSIRQFRQVALKSNIGLVTFRAMKDMHAESFAALQIDPYAQGQKRFKNQDEFSEENEGDQLFKDLELGKFLEIPIWQRSFFGKPSLKKFEAKAREFLKVLWASESRGDRLLLASRPYRANEVVKVVKRNWWFLGLFWNKYERGLVQLQKALPYAQIKLLRSELELNDESAYLDHYLAHLLVASDDFLIDKLFESLSHDHSEELRQTLLKVVMIKIYWQYLQDLAYGDLRDSSVLNKLYERAKEFKSIDFDKKEELIEIQALMSVLIEATPDSKLKASMGYHFLIIGEDAFRANNRARYLRLEEAKAKRLKDEISELAPGNWKENLARYFQALYPSRYFEIDRDYFVSLEDAFLRFQDLKDVEEFGALRAALSKHLQETRNKARKDLLVPGGCEELLKK